MKRERTYEIVLIGALAGLAGGLAEIAWVGIYATLGGTSAHAVAVAITDTLGLRSGLPTVDFWQGIGIHMAVAALIGMGVVATLRSPWCRFRFAATEALAAIGLLVAIWGFNFFILGPIVSPAFVEMMPLAITFASKTLFGLSAAAVLWAERRLRPDVVGSDESGKRHRQPEHLTGSYSV